MEFSGESSTLHTREFRAGSVLKGVWSILRRAATFVASHLD